MREGRRLLVHMLGTVTARPSVSTTATSETTAEREVVAFTEHEARALGLSLTIVHRSELSDPWPVGEDVAVARLLVLHHDRVESLLRSARNHEHVFSAGDLHSARAVEGTRTLRSRCPGVACLVAIVPDQTAST